ncbi:UTP--glucose-1-phosphate uridylyltransferase, partial [Escherichia coli]|nr:UTP--glucose-1-phosphate uridylyltransferase [Escherichia coli]
VSNFGIVDCMGEHLQPGDSKPITRVVEKPKKEEAPSNLSIVGRYVLSENIWPLLAKTAPGAGDEIQLTDAIAMLIEKEPVEAYHLQGKSHDCGNKLGYMKAFVEYGLQHEEFGEEFTKWIKSLQA